jgi:hypothetical protein
MERKNVRKSIAGKVAHHEDCKQTVDQRYFSVRINKYTSTGVCRDGVGKVGIGYWPEE